MHLRIASCSLAVSAAFGMMTPDASAAPTVYFVTPGAGATISGSINQSSACEVRGSNIRRVRFFLGSTALNTEGESPWNCNLDTRKFSDGSHTLKAVAYDSAGASRSTQISVNIRNSTSSGSVSFKTPAANGTLSGSISASSACEVVGSNIKGVQFYLDGTALNKEGSAPWNCDIDTTKFADGAHTLKAVATYSDGKSGSAQIPVAIKNGSSAPSSSSVSFKTPAANGTLSGSISASSACEVVGSNIKGVQFYLDGTALNKEGSAPWNCDIDTRKFADGAHTLKAVATYSDGKSGSAQIAVNIDNDGSSKPDPVASDCANPSGGYEGFGRNTTGGAGKPVYKVTNLKDSGSGSLRDAVSRGNRCVVFDVGGTISLASNLLVKGANVTIDALTAPSPGITLKGATLVMQGTSGAGNVVLRGIRHRGAPSGADAIRVFKASNVVIDRISVSGFGDGAVDVTENSRDVTVQWSILGAGDPSHNFVNLVGYNTTRVTLHHNLYINGTSRHPQCANLNYEPTAELQCDVRNNVIWNYGQKGTSIRFGAKGNVVNNYYYSSKASGASNTVYSAEKGVVYAKGNYSRNGYNVDAQSTRSSELPAIRPTTTDARTAAREVVKKAGARGAKFGLDSADRNYVGAVSID